MLTIANTPNGYEVREDGHTLFGPASEVEAEAFYLDVVWSAPFGTRAGRTQ